MLKRPGVLALCFLTAYCFVSSKTMASGTISETSQIESALNGLILPWSENVSMTLTNGYDNDGPDDMHSGIKGMSLDFAKTSNEAIYSPAMGVVGFIGSGWNGGYGNCVFINTYDGLTIVLGHLLSVDDTIKKGEKIEQGQFIGYMGSTGLSTGTHLHFEIRKGEDMFRPDKKTKIFGDYIVGDFSKTHYYQMFKGAVVERKASYAPPASTADEIIISAEAGKSDDVSGRSVSQSSSNPKIVGLHSQMNPVLLGEVAAIDVKTSDNVTRVDIFNDRGALVGMSETPASTQNGVKEWLVDFKAEYAGVQTITAIARFGGETASETASLSVTVETAVIYSVETNKTLVKSGEFITVVIVTNKAANEIWIEDGTGKYCNATSFSQNGDRRVWEAFWRPTDIGMREAFAYASDADGNVDSLRFAVSMQDEE
ncbi:MAG: M23 family metallopeptidase [Clostridiales bacterium]|jgi:hypothetical protein|nr:M23 family metallopeptidase [Clostridiales bacterium]